MKICAKCLMFLVLTTTTAQAALFNDVSLSIAAQNALVAHFDARVGVNTSGSTVNSWDAYDGTGNNVVATLNSFARPGGGDADLITTDGTTVLFDDPTTSSHGRYLSGSLSTTAANQSYTIFWLGHYDSDNRNGFENSGAYAYNLGSEASHQRDDAAPGFRVELYDGSATYTGDQITAYDDVDTVWTTIYTPTSHTAYADGTNLNVGGTPSYLIADDPTLVMGAFSSGGYDMLGQISQFIIFEEELSGGDIAAVENYLSSIPEPASLMLLAAGAMAMLGRRRTA